MSTRKPYTPPRWIREVSWMYNAWFAILLPAVGIYALYEGEGGWTLIGWGVVDLVMAICYREDRPRFRR